ncbi:MULTISPECIES: hypothetical protein [unclassified Phormidesmis]
MFPLSYPHRGNKPGAKQNRPKISFICFMAASSYIAAVYWIGRSP